MSEFSGENIIPSNSVAGKLSINVVNVPWDQVLNMVMEFTGYKSKKIGDSIYIETPSDSQVIQKVDISKDKNELPKVPIVTKTKDTIRAEWEQETEYGKVHKIAEIKGNGRIIGDEINKSKKSTNSNYYGRDGNGTETKTKCEFKSAMSNEEIKNCQN